MLGLGHRADGLSIEESGIRYISLKKNKAWEIRKKRFLPLRPGMIIENRVADSEALLEAIKAWVKQEGLRGTRVSLTLPPSQIIIRKMTLPATNEKQLQQLVKLEVETGLHLPFENPVYDYVITEAGENESQLLVFAAPRKPIQDYIEILEKAGIRVGRVEISATALARSLSMGLETSFSETMLIHMEQSVMDIYMFRSGEPVFIRTISLQDLHQDKPSGMMLSEEYLLEAAAASAGAEEHLSPEQIVEITAEISRMLNFYQYSLHDGTTKIRNILITGSEQLRQQLDRELKQALAEVEISPIVLEQLGAQSQQDKELNSYRVAVGAAIAGTEKIIDLLPREDREAIMFPYVALALVGIWMLGVIGTGMYYMVNQGQISNQEQEIQGLQDRNLMLHQELDKSNNSGGGLLDRKAAIDEILKYKLSAVAVLAELAQRLPQGGVLRDIVYTYRTSIDLTVSVPSMESASAYLAELRAMSFTVDASIQKLTEGDTASGVGGSAASSLQKTYTAVYKVNMSALQQQDSAQKSQEEVSGDGTDQ
ncbi:pilus assembly protein PilM [Paenibacillus sp. sgz500958]|uniref:pilus assembly protein PilM n=1 Tax=Paenibacillus sp. sgz500958 TaxID=3242475 RepID=UPI0036D3C5AD